MAASIRSLLAAALLFAIGAFPSAPVAAEEIVVDGSSTVYPLSREAARRFLRRERGVDLRVNFSGTTAGFRRFCAGELDIGDASRPINDEEKAACSAGGVRYRELQIAMDSIAIVVHPGNHWANEITVAELRRLWAPEAENKIKTWKQVRASWPDRPLVLFGRGQDSGTYDFFTHAVVGTTRSSRKDYTGSEDEEMLVAGIAGQPDALGFFGIGAYHRHWDTLKLIAVDNGDGPVYPSLDTIKQDLYRPLTRPLFLYVNEDRLAQKAVLRRFLEAYVGGIASWIHFTGFMPLPQGEYQRSLKLIQAP